MFSEVSWPFKLVIKDRVNNEEFSYAPRSDAMYLKGFPLMTMEFQSDPDKRDRHRMLLQAGCLARLGQHLSKDQKKLFIVTAIYISKDRVVALYFVYQSSAQRNEVGTFSKS